MAKVVVVGGGVGGLASALFLGQRGHDVVLLERDDGPPAGTVEDDFDHWRRPGVPQARMPHNFLGLGATVLADEAPDVLTTFLERGVFQTPVSVGGRGVATDGERPLFALLSRRLVFEAVVWRAVQDRSGVQVRTQTPVAELVVHHRGPRPVAQGVRTEAGEEVAADLVVDASGRRSPIERWLAAAGVAPAPTTVQECGFQYYARHYRLKDGREFPSVALPITSPVPYATALAFPADNRTFSLANALFIDDPHRRAVRRPEVFDRVMAAFPLIEPWLDAGDPISDVETMARLENRWRRLVDDGGRPVVGGLVLVGDSSLHTNPTFGRGASLALAQAQHLADTAEQSVSDPVGYVSDFEQWTADNLAVWFWSQVAADRANLDRFAACLAGQELPLADDPISRSIAALFALAPTDDVVARALAKMGHLLMTPAELTADADVMGRVGAYLDTHPVIAPTFKGPDRATFERLVTAPA